MDAVREVEGRAIPFGAKNVDTDVIIPAHWLKTVTREGLGRGAFETVRADPGNVFDDPAFASAPILIAGDNFGCGSSREHAPWALEDYGFRAVIAPSFADIFRSNCTKIGLLPVELPEDAVRAIAEAGECQVDLAAQEVRWAGGTATFDIDADTKHRLLNGLDDIGLTLQQDAAIAAYEQERERSGPVTTAL